MKMGQDTDRWKARKMTSVPVGVDPRTPIQIATSGYSYKPVSRIKRVLTWVVLLAVAMALLAGVLIMLKRA